ncbi:MAG: hypothetical protein AB2417_15095 [Clostridiaceae bacterium]
MKTTINYGLKKPEGTDVVNIEDLNYNADVIDQKIKEVDTKASNIKVTVTSINGKTGAVALAASDVGAVPAGRKVNNKPLSSDITLSATDIKTSSGTTVESQLAQKATKTEVGNINDATLPTELKGKSLTEQTKQLFQFASEGKNKIATAITAKGVVSSPNDTFPTLATKVGQIKTGYGIEDTILTEDLEEVFKMIWTFKGHTSTLQEIKVDKNDEIISVASDRTLRKISQLGNQIWQFNFSGYGATALALDRDGNSYAGGINKSVTKLSTEGKKIWEYKADSIIEHLSMGREDSFIHVATDSDGIIKINQQGDEVARISTRYWATSMIAEPNGDGMYVTVTADSKLIKFNNFGNYSIEWTRTIANNNGFILHMALNNKGFLYTGEGDIIVKRSTTSGSSIWEINLGSDISGIVIDSENNLIVTLYNKTIKKINQDGIVLKTYNGETSCFHIDIDSKDNLYGSNGSKEYSKYSKAYKVIR